MKKVIFFLLGIVFSISFFSCRKEGVSYEFSFLLTKSSNDNSVNKIVSEERILPLNPSQGELRLYVEELLLGPQTNRLIPIFSFDSSVEFCFTENNVLYLGISESSILNLPNNTDIDFRIKLLEENIKKNFKYIEKIVLFIGNEVVNE